MTTPLVDSGLARARAAAESVRDPELPMLTLADLGVLRSVEYDEGRLVVSLTPTYSGCPALRTMHDDLVHRLAEEGFDHVSVRLQLSPPWTTDWITERGRRALAEHGISPPAPAAGRSGPVPLELLPRPRAVACPRCESRDVALVSEFGSTACKALYRCRSCLEPFDHVKEH